MICPGCNNVVELHEAEIRKNQTEESKGNVVLWKYEYYCPHCQYKLFQEFERVEHKC